MNTLRVIVTTFIFTSLLVGGVAGLAAYSKGYDDGIDDAVVVYEEAIDEMAAMIPDVEY